MKKLLCAVLLLSLASSAYASDYVIRIYSNSNSSERVTWLKNAAKAAGGISVEGWKTLWKYCANGLYTVDSYGFDPLNRGDVQVSMFYSSSLYGNIDAAAQSSKTPLLGTTEPENWALVDIDDGTYYIAEYIGVLDNPKRSPEQTEHVKEFAEWFGSAEVQREWSEEFDSYPCNTDSESSEVI